MYTIEKMAKNSGDNILHSEKRVKKKKIDARNILLVQSPLALLRGGLTFEKQWKGEWESYISFTHKDIKIHKFKSLKVYIQF